MTRKAATWPREACDAHVSAAGALAVALDGAPGLSVSIPGPPVPKGRPRVSLAGARARAYTPAASARYEAHVRCLLTAECARRSWPLGGWPSASVRYAVHATVVVDRDVADVDNLLKSLLDAATGVLWPDDRRVCLALVARRVADLSRELPHATMRAWAVGPTELDDA